MQYVALRTSTPVNVTLIASSLPLWAMIVGALFYRVRPTRPQLLGAALSLAGVLTVLARGDPLALLRIQLVEGDLLMVLAIIGWAIYSWMLVRPPEHMRGAARPDWDWAEFLLAQCLFGACAAFAAAGIGEAVAASITPRWSWQLVATIVFIAVGPSIIAYRSWGLAVAEAGPAIAAVFYNLTPLITAVLSVMVIGEWPQAYHGAAFLLIVAGILVASRSTAARPG
jgi:drug/metabolite transporter (DMT)-like permease